MQTATEPATVDKPLSKFGKAEAAKFSEIKELGWSVDGEPKSWFAHEKAGDLRSIGPATSISALHTQVKIMTGTLDKGTGGGTANKPEATGNGKTVKIGSSTLEGGEFTNPADPRLPGMEEPEIDELNILGDNCITAKETRDQAKTKFEDACDQMRLKMREHDRKRYNRRGFSLVIEDSEKLVIKKAEPGKVKNPRTKKAAANA